MCDFGRRGGTSVRATLTRRVRNRVKLPRITAPGRWGDGARAGERTLTAMRSSLARAEEPNIPVLFLAGGARPGAAARVSACSARSCCSAGAPETEARPGAGCAASGRSADLGPARPAGAPRRRGWTSRTSTARTARSCRDGVCRVARPCWPGQPFFIGGHALLWRMVSAIELEAIEAEAARPLAPVATVSPGLALIVSKLRRWAESGEEVLLLGESGVGKEVYARAVHAASGRAGPFVAVNCAALPRELVESELFGYRPGAHSTAKAGQARAARAGRGRNPVSRRDRGDAPGGAGQAAALPPGPRAAPAGGDPAPAPRRAGAGRHQPSGRTRAARPLRADLLGRLGAAPVHLPPLRDRLEDLGALAGARARAGGPHAGGRASRELEAPAFRALFAYRWPLNVRELEKVLAAGAALTLGTRPIGLRDLPPALAAGVTGTTSPALPAASPGEASPAATQGAGTRALAGGAGRPAGTHQAERGRRLARARPPTRSGLALDQTVRAGGGAVETSDRRRSAAGPLAHRGEGRQALRVSR